MISMQRCILVVLSVLLLCGSCAVSPEAEERRRAMEEEIEAILSEPLAGEPQRCLADHEYRNFRALDDRRLLFEGRRGELWLNTLPTRCPDLRHSSVLVVRSIYTMRRICNMDSFQVTDWFAWPWYRRWPWHWGWGVGATCVLASSNRSTKPRLMPSKQR